ncbi:MAG: hypothetical protein O8C66_03360 [Candidatus Methanoperedens sp.]|nr:hypothetical protein [Candidatus Methanoperedens sp.]MCZ7369525.1 hypothetical protein [Candidatus Methanoperedens sp.]
MPKVEKKIGMHTLEVDYSQLTNIAKIKLDGEELLSKFLIRPFGRDHIEMVSVGKKKYHVKFGGMMKYNIMIQEANSNSEELENSDDIKFHKDRLGKINALLDKLDERLAQGEITEARYKELCEQYRTEAESLKNHVTEQELLQEVGLKAEEDEEVKYQKEVQKKSGTLAAFLSFLIPGIGQIYCGRGGRGIVIFVLNIFLVYVFVYGVVTDPNSDEPAILFLLLLLVWIWNIYDAYKLVKELAKK